MDTKSALQKEYVDRKSFDIEEIGNKLHEILEPYYRPKHILTIESIPQTENGKINRAECRILAKQMLMTFYPHTLTP